MPAEHGQYFQRGEQYAKLGNTISDAIRSAIDAGMPVYEAACVAAQVAADYARGEGGERGVIALAGVVCARGGVEIPGRIVLQTVTERKMLEGPDVPVR